MAVMTKDEFINALKVIEARPTLYKNSFPYNLCYFDGSYMTADCWNLGKAIIWSRGACKDYWTAGQYASPDTSTGLGDWDAVGIFNNLATYRSTNWSELINNGVGGEWVRMDNEHMGYHIGGGVIIESTPIWEDGVQYTHIDANGSRISAPEYGSAYGGQWTEWARLSVIDYGGQPQPQPEPTPGTGNVTYAVLDDISKSWLPFVVNDSDFAGVYGSDVDVVAIKADNASIQYCVHCWGGDESESHTSQWLEPVSQCNTSDLENGCAGIVGSPIDALAIISDKTISYRVHYRKGNYWEAWVNSKGSFDLGNVDTGFAGTIGQPIDGVQIKFA